MSTHSEFNPANLYFVTTTAVNRARIFERDIIKRILVDGLYFMSKARPSELFAFVVMPNHVHFILRCFQEYPLSNAVRDFKANTARLVVRQYQVEGNRDVLEYLSGAVSRPDRQQFKVWEDGYNAKAVYSTSFMQQKMAYIHNNPLQPQWKLAESPADYLWSSARYYLLGQTALIPLDELGVWL